MYPLDQGTWGPITRITRLRDELARLVHLEVIAGYRRERRWQLVRYAFSGRLRGLDGIYVENSSSLPSLLDIAFLALAKALGVPVLTYVRDAQYLFAEEYRPSLRRRIGGILFRPAMRLLKAVSHRVGYPSIGLAEVFADDGPDAMLLPPGAPEPLDVPPRDGARGLLYVGSMQYAVTGYDILFGAIDELRAEGRDVDLICFVRPSDDPPRPWPAWLRIERGGWPEIVARLPDAVATVQPRRRSPYSDLGVPIKLLEYLSYGRPIVTTDCTETARIVRDAGCGIVVHDSIDSFASGLRQLLDATPDEVGTWSANARAAAERHSWAATAQRIVAALGEISSAHVRPR